MRRPTRPSPDVDVALGAAHRRLLVPDGELLHLGTETLGAIDRMSHGDAGCIAEQPIVTEVGRIGRMDHRRSACETGAEAIQPNSTRRLDRDLLELSGVEWEHHVELAAARQHRLGDDRVRTARQRPIGEAHRAIVQICRNIRTDLLRESDREAPQPRSSGDEMPAVVDHRGDSEHVENLSADTDHGAHHLELPTGRGTRSPVARRQRGRQLQRLTSRADVSPDEMRLGRRCGRPIPRFGVGQWLCACQLQGATCQLVCASDLPGQ